MLNNIEKLFPSIPGVDNDGTPHFLLGKDACVGSLRKLQGDDDDDDETDCNACEGVLMVDKTIQTGTSNNQEGGTNEDDEEEEEERLLCYLKSTDVTVTLPQQGTSITNVTTTRGKIFVTTKRVLFVAHEEEAAAFDLSVNAYCISLHALMSEPTHSVYCQLVSATTDGVCPSDLLRPRAEDEQDQEQEQEFDSPSAEVVIKPVIAKDGVDQTKGQELCQTLFNALTKLINLNPIRDDDDDDDDDSDGEEGGDIMGMSGSRGLASMLFGFFGASGDGPTQLYGKVDEKEDIVYRIDSSNQISGPDDTHAMTEEESERRDRMLSHLDNLLVVPPEYERMEGQFEDASEDDKDSDQDIL
jgi:hypothetical protein